MPDLPSLLIVISAHGFGHLSQISPIINGLYEHVPNLRITIQTEMPEATVKRRVSCPFTLVNHTADIGMLMSGPTVIRWEDSLQAYRRFHRHWHEHMDSQSAILQKHQPDLVMTDIPYLPLAAAADLGIPAIAYSSLNWVDIIEANPDIAARMQPELETMREAYGRAECFIQPEPSMPMPWLAERCPIGPVMEAGESLRQHLIEDLGIDSAQKLVLVSLGGIPLASPLSHWPKIPGVHWLIPDSHGAARADVNAWEDDRYKFTDLIASVDLVVTKPGYGMFTEIAACGVPALNVARPDWGETEVLERWIKRHVPFKTVPLNRLLQGEISSEITALLDAPRGRPIEPTGIRDAVKRLAPRLYPV